MIVQAYLDIFIILAYRFLLSGDRFLQKWYNYYNEAKTTLTANFFICGYFDILTAS